MATSSEGRRRRRGAAAALLAVGVLVLAVLAAVVVGGGGGGCDAAGYPETPDCVAREYVTRTDASKCDLVAPALLEELTGARDEEARRRCAANVRGSSPPDEVEVLERETIGNMVVIELLTDGREGKVTMTQVGGRWQITSFAE